MRGAYLNHAGTSWPKPLPVQESVTASILADPCQWEQKLREAHRAVASYFHISDESHLLFTPGCTSALAVAIADLAWDSGVVLTSHMEHHALHRPLQQLGDRGLTLEVIPRSLNGPFCLDALEAALQRGNARIVAITAAANVTGELLPMQSVIQMAHDYGALVLIDGAQIGGWWDLDLQELDADIFTFAGHKGLQAPWGIGGLTIGPRVVMRTPIAGCEASTGNSDSCAIRPGYCDVGSVDHISLAGLHAAVNWLSSPELTNRLTNAKAMAQRLWTAVASRPGVRMHSPEDPCKRMPTVAFTVADRPSAEVSAVLLRENVVTSGGFQCAPLAHTALGTTEQGVVRMSVGPMTTDAEIDDTIDRIEKRIG